MMSQSLFMVQTVAQTKACSQNAFTEITLEHHNWLLEKYRLIDCSLIQIDGLLLPKAFLVL